MPQDISGYDVGALLYCPANAHHTVAQAVAAERLPRPFSLALCLEDTVRATPWRRQSRPWNKPCTTLQIPPGRRRFTAP